MAAELTIHQLMEAMERLNARIHHLEARDAERDNPGRRRGLLDKSIQPAHFDGMGYRKWAEDLFAIVEVKMPEVARAMEWAIAQGDDATSEEEARLAIEELKYGDCRELHRYLMHCSCVCFGGQA